MHQWMQPFQGGVRAEDVMYVPSQLPGPVQTGIAQHWPERHWGEKSTTFFTPLDLVLGDCLALLIYCVIIKLGYLDISSTITMWLERERESNALNIFLVDNFLWIYRVAEGWNFQTVLYWFCFDPFFEMWINKIWFLQKSLQLPLEVSSYFLGTHGREGHQQR